MAEEESSMIKTKFRAMESVVARWRMNPLLNEETGKSEVVEALANAAKCATRLKVHPPLRVVVVVVVVWRLVDFSLYHSIVIV